MTRELQRGGIGYREGEPLSAHTTMGVGGEAAVMAFPRSPEELRTTLQIRSDLQVPHRVLGGGDGAEVGIGAGVPGDAHALGDALATARVLLRLLDEARGRGVRDLIAARGPAACGSHRAASKPSR